MQVQNMEVLFLVYRSVSMQYVLIIARHIAVNSMCLGFCQFVFDALAGYDDLFNLF